MIAGIPVTYLLLQKVTGLHFIICFNLLNKASPTLRTQNNFFKFELYTY